MQGSNNKEWLIKSAGEIKGPYTFEEIVEGIHTKEFILVDEIACKFSRWKYLREEEVFEKAILEHKNKEYSKGEKTFTDSATDSLTEEIKNDAVTFRAKGGLLSNIEEHLKEKEQARAHNQKTESQVVDDTQVKNYAAAADLKKQASEKRSIAIGVGILVVGFILAVGFAIKNKEAPLSYDDVKKLAYDNINNGNFSEAKIYLEKALAVNGTNEELKYLLSYVSVDTEDTVTAQRLLNDLKQSVEDKKLKSQVYNLSGILQLKNFSLAEAKKSFEASLKEDSKFPAALFNKGVAFFLENKFTLAHESFTQSLVSGGIDGAILLAMTELIVRPGSDIKRDSQQVGDILNLLVRQSNSLYSYRQEMKIASAYLYNLIGDTALMEKSIDEAINVDPRLTTDHVLDVSYYKGLVTWDKLAIWIKKMRDIHPKNENLRTLYGYALFRGSEKLKGKDIVEGLLKSNYSNTSNQIIYSYILMSLMRDDDAKAALGPVMHYRDKSLSFIMMGRICQIKKDLPCADLNFNEALRIDKNNISALVGLAEVYFAQKELAKSTELVKQVYKMSLTYKPALNLKQKLDALKN